MASISPLAVLAMVDRIHAPVQAVYRLHDVAVVAGRAAIVLSQVARQALAMAEHAELTTSSARAARAIVGRINVNRYHPRSIDDV